MTKLNLLDQYFIVTEQGGMSPMYMGGAMILDPSTARESLDGTMLANHLAACLEEVPVMRQKVVQDDLGIGNMRVVDDPDFDVNNHVTVVYFEEPAGYHELTEYLGNFSIQRLDLDRPLWHFEVIEGLEKGYIAIALHIHHSIMDGVGARDAMASLWSDQPIAARTPRTDAWRSRTPPGSLSLMGDALAENIKRLYVDTPAFLLKNSRPILQTLSSMIGKRLQSQQAHDAVAARTLPPAKKTSLNPPRLSDKRAVAYLDLPLKDIKALRKTHNCTVNDLVLFINSWALEHYFREVGEVVDFDLITAMPINTREAGDASIGNSVAVARVNLHNTIPGARERLKAIATDTLEIRQSTQRGRQDDSDQPKVDYGALSGLFSPIVLEALVYGVTRFNLLDKVTFFNVAITNVAGSPTPLYVAGARLVSNVPMAPCNDIVALTISVSSTENLLSIGYHGCGKAIKDKELLVAGARAAFAVLQPKSKSKTKPKAKSQNQPRNNT